jgi:hypothetical protein
VDRFVIALAQGEGDHFTDRGLVIDDQDAFLHEDTVGLGYWSGASRLRFDDMFVTAWPEPAGIAIGRSCSAQRRSRSGSCTPWRRSSSTVGVIASMRASTRARPVVQRRVALERLQLHQRLLRAAAEEGGLGIGLAGAHAVAGQLAGAGVSLLEDRIVTALRQQGRSMACARWPASRLPCSFRISA